MNARNFFKMKLISRYLIVAAGLLTANYAAAGKECNCADEVKSLDVSGRVGEFELPIGMQIPENEAFTPEGLIAKKDANSFVYPMYQHKGVWYVRFGFEKGTWGPNGGKVIIGSGEDMHDGAVREFAEENAGALMISKETFAAFAKVFATKNHFGLPEVLYFINMKSLLPQKFVVEALATVQGRAAAEACAKVVNNPEKTCSFATVTDHAWVAFADVHKNFFSDVVPSGKFPFYAHSADKSLANDQAITARTLQIDEEGNIIDVVEKEFNIRRNATPSHFRNVTFAKHNKDLKGQEELIYGHADAAQHFCSFLAQEKPAAE